MKIGGRIKKPMYGFSFELKKLRYDGIDGEKFDDVRKRVKFSYTPYTTRNDTLSDIYDQAQVASLNVEERMVNDDKLELFVQVIMERVVCGIDLRDTLTISDMAKIESPLTFYDIIDMIPGPNSNFVRTLSKEGVSKPLPTPL
ncbi:12597_t:CDS:2 [Rhizophagus irregularis]|nr:12597_t:CDS:2 [Rhizophagus irregularis]